MATHGTGNARSGKRKYPSSFYNYSAKLDLTRINKPILQLWITNEITSLLGFEDEIVTNTVINLFGLSTADDFTSNADQNFMSSQQLNEMIDPKQAHVVLSGFFNDDAALQFCVLLWDYMIDASQQPNGIPRQIIEAKKRQLQEEKQHQQSTVNTTQLQRPNELPSSIQNQNPARKRRNRWDNNDAPAVNIHPNHEQRPPNERTIILVPPDELPPNEKYMNNDRKTSRDEYGRSRKHERDYARDDRNNVAKEKSTKQSSDPPVRHRRRNFDDDDVDGYDHYRSDHYDRDRQYRRRRENQDRSSSDRRNRDRHDDDDDYYQDKQHKRKRQY